MSSAALFRDEVVRGRLQEIGVPLGLGRVWARVYAAGLVLAIAVGTLLILFGHYPRKARVTGYLTPDKGLIKVMCTRPGRIAEIRVAESQHVEKGDVLAIIDVSAISTAGRTFDLVRDNLRARRRLVEQELERLDTVQSAEALRVDAQIAALKEQIIAIETDLKVRADFARLAQSAFQRSQALEIKGTYSLAQREQAEQQLATANIQLADLKSTYATIVGGLHQSQADRVGLSDRQANDRSQLQRTMAEVDQLLLQNEDQRYEVIRASESGTATRVAASLGAPADPSIPLLTVVPDDARLEADLYVPSNAAGFVKVGNRVLLRYEPYPYQKFGTHEGNIAAIARTAVSGKELPFPVTSEEPLYLVTAELAKETVTAFGHEEHLSAGTKFEADLILEDRKIWEWILEPLLAVQKSA